jgi:hypothetical protein
MLYLDLNILNLKFTSGNLAHDLDDGYYTSVLQNYFHSDTNFFNLFNLFTFETPLDMYGIFLYMEYWHLFIICTFILLVAMIGPILLILEVRNLSQGILLKTNKINIFV